MGDEDCQTLVGCLHFHIDRARKLPDTDHIGISFLSSGEDLTDPFVVVEIEHVFGNEELFRTEHIEDTLEPIWSHYRNIDISYCVKKIIFHVKDNDRFGSESVASLEIPANEITDGETIDGWFDLEDENHEKAGQLKISVTYISSIE